MHPARSLLVYLTTVPDSRYFHQEPRVVDRVHHSVVAYTDAPFLVAAFELLATGRPWIETKTFQTGENTLIQFRGEAV
jgi:hypothetical protein